jgi:hypothetical protein
MRKIKNVKGMQIYEFEIGDRVIRRNEKDSDFLDLNPYKHPMDKSIKKVFIIKDAKENFVNPSYGNLVMIDDGTTSYRYSARFLPFFGGEHEEVE